MYLVANDGNHLEMVVVTRVSWAKSGRVVCLDVSFGTARGF